MKYTKKFTVTRKDTVPTLKVGTRYENIFNSNNPGKELFAVSKAFYYAKSE